MVRDIGGYYRFQSNIWATLLFIMFFLSFFLACPEPTRDYQVVRPAISARLCRTRTVVIDPGHGGSDPGTIGVGRTTGATMCWLLQELKALLEELEPK